MSGKLPKSRAIVPLRHGSEHVAEVYVWRLYLIDPKSAGGRRTKPRYENFTQDELEGDDQDEEEGEQNKPGLHGASSRAV
jgi:hypothetical protein